MEAKKREEKKKEGYVTPTLMFQKQKRNRHRNPPQPQLLRKMHMKSFQLPVRVQVRVTEAIFRFTGIEEKVGAII